MSNRELCVLIILAIAIIALSGLLLADAERAVEAANLEIKECRESVATLEMMRDWRLSR